MCMNAPVQPQNPLAYSPADAGKLIGLSRSRIYELLAQNEIQAIKIGRNRRILRSSIEGYLTRLMDEQAVQK